MKPTRSEVEEALAIRLTQMGDDLVTISAEDLAHKLTGALPYGAWKKSGISHESEDALLESSLEQVEIRYRTRDGAEVRHTYKSLDGQWYPTIKLTRSPSAHVFVLKNWGSRSSVVKRWKK